ncbi:Nucleoside-diphosphate-sugar epimerase [Geosmithia morbida]|uniref:Nucleoside-diphosphate-sugar epimerase n=1 Tax=Geosmithia morbida TaxID=1094350 RepID=A0A9P5D1M4_9HYPO|nr:Nucleoside-diphosphate-sugar epimerase [Geosmithia morbida]KAF4124083.1 Nucleoside-diphosphate-sugar epimerase [Geosmithia morbida]
MGVMLGSAAAAVACLSVYAYRLNKVLASTPPEAGRYAMPRLAEEEARAVYEQVEREGRNGGYDRGDSDGHGCANPFRARIQAGMPTRRDRRYIVVGGSGLVGGEIVLALLGNGTPAEAIRIVDVREPMRDEFRRGSGAASRVPVFLVDISSERAVREAFEAEWPDEEALVSSTIPTSTVFHTAAVIRWGERSNLFWDRIARVNIAGTANVISASRAAGAGILIYTSSASVENREVNWFPAPWRRYPTNFVQHIDGSAPGGFSTDEGGKKSDKPDDQYPTTYARTKAVAEKLVCEADDSPSGSSSGSRMRTGAIRPGNAIYGHIKDPVVGQMLSLRWVPSFNAAWVQSWVSSANVALAHVQLESAMLGEHVDSVAGRPFVVTDDGPPIICSDYYALLSATSRTGFEVTRPPPLLFLSMFYVIEAWAILSTRFPGTLGRLLGEPGPPIDVLQPGTAAAAINSIIHDHEARMPVGQGGMGYRPVCTTVEGICAVVAQWNRFVDEGKDKDKE